MNEQSLILIIEKSKKFGEELQNFLEAPSRRMKLVRGEFEALQMLNLFHFDLIIMDKNTSLVDPEETLRLIRKKDQEIPIITLLDKDSAGTRFYEIIRKENVDYLFKPIELAILTEKVENLLYDAELRHEMANLRRKLKEDYGFDNIIGRCDAMKKVFHSIKQVANSTVGDS